MQGNGTRFKASENWAVSPESPSRAPRPCALFSSVKDVKLLCQTAARSTSVIGAAKGWALEAKQYSVMAKLLILSLLHPQVASNSWEGVSIGQC